MLHHSAPEKHKLATGCHFRPFSFASPSFGGFAKYSVPWCFIYYMPNSWESQPFPRQKRRKLMRKSKKYCQIGTQHEIMTDSYHNQ